MLTPYISVKEKTLILQVPTIKGTRAPRALYSRYLEG